MSKRAERGREEDSDEERKVAPTKFTVITRGRGRPKEGERSTGGRQVIPPQELNEILLNVGSIESARENESQALRECNEKLGSYLEKSRFYELQNERLRKEIADIKKNMGKEQARIKKMYETEEEAIKILLEKSKAEGTKLNDRYNKVKDEVEKLKRLLEEEEKQTQEAREQGWDAKAKVVEIEAQLSKDRLSIAKLEQERNDLKIKKEKLQEQLRNLRYDLEQETISQLEAKNNEQALKEEIEYFKSICEQERKELTALAQRDLTLEAREAWTSEIGPLFKELHDRFDNELDRVRNEAESQYKMKVQEIRMNQAKGGAEMAVLTREYDRLNKLNNELDSKLTTLKPKREFLKEQKKNLEEQLAKRTKEYEDNLKKYNKALEDAKNEIARIAKDMEKIKDQQVSLTVQIAEYRQLLELCEKEEKDEKEKKDLAEKLLGRKK